MELRKNWTETDRGLEPVLAPGGRADEWKNPVRVTAYIGLDPATTPIIDARLDDGSRLELCGDLCSPGQSPRCDHHPAIRQADV